jgi:hypothetical protein
VSHGRVQLTSLGIPTVALPEKPLGQPSRMLPSPSGLVEVLARSCAPLATIEVGGATCAVSERLGGVVDKEAMT